MSADGGKLKHGPRMVRQRAPGAPYSIEQAAAALNLSPRTVRQRIRDGMLVAYQDGRLWRIPERAMAEYLANREGDWSPPIGTGMAVRRHLQ